MRWVEPNTEVGIAVRTNDPMRQDQWGLRYTNAYEGWEIERGLSSPVVVAVLDTGVALDHPEFKGRLVDGFDFVNNDFDPDDDHSHGTHMSGVIAAQQDNEIGVAGLSWGAQIMPVKVMNEEGGGELFSIAQGIVYAALHGAPIQNLSLGGASTRCPRVEQAAIDFAWDRNSLIVAGAGNSGADGNPPFFPAGCDRVLAVAAVDSSGKHASFSGYRSYVDVAAPGVDILSPVPGFVETPTYGYVVASGTSPATAYASGLAALLLSQNPGWGPAELTKRIRSSSVDHGPKGKDPRFGWGVMDVRRALAR